MQTSNRASSHADGQEADACHLMHGFKACSAYQMRCPDQVDLGRGTAGRRALIPNRGRWVIAYLCAGLRVADDCGLRHFGVVHRERASDPTRLVAESPSRDPRRIFVQPVRGQWLSTRVAALPLGGGGGSLGGNCPSSILVARGDL